MVFISLTIGKVFAQHGNFLTSDKRREEEYG